MTTAPDRPPIIPPSASVREQLAYHCDQVTLLRRLLRLALSAERSAAGHEPPHGTEARHAG